MDSLNFLNTIYFIWQSIQNFFCSLKEQDEDSDKESITDLDAAIEYFSADPTGLLNSIMSFDISLYEIDICEKTFKEFLVVARVATNHIKQKRTFPSFINGIAHRVYLRNFLLEGTDSDLKTTLQTFFTISGNYLKAHKEVKTNDPNHRLGGSLASSLISIKEIFEEIEFATEE